MSFYLSFFLHCTGRPASKKFFILWIIRGYGVVRSICNGVFLNESQEDGLLYIEGKIQ